MNYITKQRKYLRKEVKGYDYGGLIMKVVVNEETCTGCEICSEKLPEIFAIKKGIAVVLNPNPEASYKDALLEVIEECPSGSITLEE